MSVVHRFDPPDRFVAGTVGEPGARTFFLQAREGRRLVSVSLEKEQVALLAERVDELLDEVTTATPTLIPAMAPLGLVDNDPLDQPIEEEFRAGTMTLSWDSTDERIVIEVYPFDETLAATEDLTDVAGLLQEAEETPPEELLVVRLDSGRARAFAKRALQVVGAGRPTCPFCGGPIDPEGHLCPRANGFKRRDP
ncbi:DUF3090 domain-containing protein [Nocardioides sp. Kera G14]|uniref:DUF3090 domain-containing protein n=1 Tax=Nocardioides sp. Kera G14 TaxID=2884264 RepID=UPI001D11AA06|nr:DUF3090 domain-containing protein [Nocardioides sp. Kera G14]UDY25174.1 DUF3090 domain-containing protein [Nocardioides sp. Kera G14]